MSVAPKASLIIRCKNEALDIGGVLCALYSQKTDFDFEVIAVDSGSTDGTLEILRRFPVRIIEIPPEAFTWGYALNVGCRAAQGEILLALSAHVYPRTSRWLHNHVRHFDDPRVAATSYGRTFLVQDAEAFLANPYVGYDNANGAFRAALWRQAPFDEAMNGTEDKAWAFAMQQRGHVVVIDPEVDALHEHPAENRYGLIRDRYIRAYREHLGFASFLRRGPLLRALARALKRNPPANRESLAWYAGAVLGILRGGREPGGGRRTFA